MRTSPALAFTPMPARGRRRLSESIASERKTAMQQFFRDHEDA